MAKESISKQEIIDELEAIKNSSRVIGAEGLVLDIDNIIERIRKDL